MSEVERRRSYWYNAILIESDRVLNPVHDDALIYVTGAQIELLRNITQYLSRRQTYVDENHPGYYLVPDDSDYDEILAIVADLEETLMGNPNTIWGYEDRWVEHTEYTAVATGAVDVPCPPVPDGYVYTLQSVVMRNLTTNDATIPKIQSPGILVGIGDYVAHNATALRIESGLNYTLKSGDYVLVRFYSTQDEDELEVFTWGYKMKVPED